VTPFPESNVHICVRNVQIQIVEIINSWPKCQDNQTDQFMYARQFISQWQLPIYSKSNIYKSTVADVASAVYHSVMNKRYNYYNR